MSTGNTYQCHAVYPYRNLSCQMKILGPEMANIFLSELFTIERFIQYEVIRELISPAQFASILCSWHELLCDGRAELRSDSRIFGTFNGSRMVAVRRYRLSSFNVKLIFEVAWPIPLFQSLYYSNASPVIVILEHQRWGVLHTYVLQWWSRLLYVT